MAGRIIMAMLAKFFVFISFDAVYVYAAELFPTVIRYGSLSVAMVTWHAPPKEIANCSLTNGGFSFLAFAFFRTEKWLRSFIALSTYL